MLRLGLDPQKFFPPRDIFLSLEENVENRVQVKSKRQKQWSSIVL